MRVRVYATILRIVNDGGGDDMSACLPILQVGLGFRMMRRFASALAR